MNTVYDVKVSLGNDSNPMYHIKYDDGSVLVMTIHTLTDISKVMTLIKDTKTFVVNASLSNMSFKTLIEKASFTSLKTLFLEDMIDHSEYALSDVLDAIPTLTRVSLTNCTFRLGNGLKSDTLKHLYINRSTIVNKNMYITTFGEEAPPNLNGLSSLKYLFIKDVSTTYMPIINECTRLKTVYIANLSDGLKNNLDDHDWSAMKSLENLTIKNINMSNTTKENALDWIGQLSKVKDLTISKCRLVGVTLPHSICSLTNLECLDLSKNRLSGTIPSNIGVLSKLSTLDLSGNQLTGSIPSSVCTLPLNTLKLSHNRLTGTIPSDIGRLTSVYSLKLHNNKLEGAIPDDIGILSNLRILKLSSNKLTGTIPTSLYSLSNLQDIYLLDNPLDAIVLPDSGSNTELSVHIDPTRVKIEGSRWSVSKWSRDEFIRTE